MKKVILILSGGMDSVTLLYYLLDKGYKVEAISFNYGQKHKRELECAKKICKLKKIPHFTIDMRFLGGLLNSSLTQKNQEVPKGYYTDKSMKKTIVPHRNLMMIVIANAIGLSKGISEVAYAAHAGDHAIYPDCRPNFVTATENVLKFSFEKQDIKIISPFINIDKTDILRIGLNLRVPYDLTWTCYDPQEDEACGKCGSCRERLEAFKSCRIADPLKYKK